jgi:apolipoprotein N-acyltransferase
VVASFDKTRTLPLIESSWTFPAGLALEALMGLAPDRPLVERGREEAPLHGGFEVPVTLCAEILYPDLVAARRRLESPALVNLADDSWFAEEAAARQAVAFASFRAIEQRLWLVRAAHRGVSAVIDPYGRIVAALRFGEKGALRAKVSRQPPPGVLERDGLAGLLAAGAVTGRLVAQILLRKRRPS